MKKMWMPIPQNVWFAKMQFLIVHSKKEIWKKPKIGINTVTGKNLMRICSLKLDMCLQVICHYKSICWHFGFSVPD